MRPPRKRGDGSCILSREPIIATRLAVTLCLCLSLLQGCGDNGDGSENGPEPGADGGTADGAVDVDNGASEIPDYDFSAFDQEVEAYLAENGLQGAGAAVVHREYGLVHEMGYGAFDVDRIYLIASSSKILSVGVVMRLTDQELLDIDEPISTYLAEWGEYKTDITTAQLLSNSSGLVGLTDNPLYAPYICQYMSVGTLTDCAKSIYTADDEADRVPPDTAFRYGGGPWQLAGGIAEVVSGKSWAELVEETYFQPCATTSLGYTNQFMEAFTSGGSGGNVGAALSYPDFFQADVANLPLTNNPAIEGGAYITAADYGEILLMHLRGGLCDGGRVLSEEAVARMQQDRILEVYGGSTFNPLRQGYGLGWWVDRENPGVFVDSGAYGAVPWLDLPRDYGAIIILEADTLVGVSLYETAKPALDAVFDQS